MRDSVERGNIATFLDLQSSDKPKFYRRAFIYRRYWDEVEEKYVWEDEATELTADVLSWGKIVYEQAVKIGEWRFSNCSIDLHSTDRYYGRVSDFWVGYIPDFSRVVLEAGYVDSGGNQHGVKVFTGYITPKTGINEHGIVDDMVSIALLGSGAILDMFKAYDLPLNNRLNEPLAGTGRVWVTTDTAIGEVGSVYVSGVRLSKGKDYDVADENIKDSAATIEFTEAYGTPAAVPTSDYVFWDTDATFEDLITKLLDYAGIESRNIAPVRFGNLITVTRSFSEDSDFDAGIKKNTLTFSDSIRKNIWFHNPNVLTSVFFSEPWPQTAYQKLIFKEDIEVDTVSFFQLVTQVQSYTGIMRIRVDSSGNPGSIIASSSFTGTSGKITLSPRDGINRVTLLKDTFYWLEFEIEQATMKNTAWNQEIAIKAAGPAINGQSVRQNQSTVDRTMNLIIQSSETDFNWMSDTASLVEIENFLGLIASTSTTGIFSFYTRTQESDSGWPVAFEANDWDLVTEGVVNSPANNFARLAIVFQKGGDTTPYGDEYPIYVSSAGISYAAGAFHISVANYTGMSCRDALAKLSEMCNYAFGFNTRDTFFFRPLSFKQSADLVLSYEADEYWGFDIDRERIVNEIRVSHGGYRFVINSRTEDEPKPHSINKYGTQTLSPNFATIAGDPDAEIAEGIGRVYYDEFGKLPVDREAYRKFEFSMMPKLGVEVGDVFEIRSSKSDKPPFNMLWYVGRYELDLDNFSQSFLMRELKIVE